MIRNEIRKALESFAEGAAFSLEVPPKPEYGDFATNLPIVLGKLQKKNPMEVAEKLAAKISNPLITSVTVASPGFLNITVSEETYQKELEAILRGKEAYGGASPKNKKIQVEFISANPTGPLTLANGRGGFFGDILSNILTSQGYDVEREYYVNDAGNQIRVLGLSVLAAAGNAPNSEDYYHGDHIDEWAKAHPEILESMKNDPESLGRAVAEYFLRELIQKPIEEKMKIQFDHWTFEYHLHNDGLVEKARNIFDQKGLTYKNDGAIWLKTTEFGDDKDRVLITRDGFPTYLMADGGHYLETKERGFHEKILILGADHHGYVERLQAVANIVALPESNIIVMQLVRLLKGGKEVRMSKRRGTFITIEEVIDEVGTDAARYFFLEKNPETHVDFDLDLAKKASKENPVYYIQYAYARLAGIFRKGVMIPDSFSISHLRDDSARALIRRLAEFPAVLEDTAADFRVSRLVHFAYDLAHDFHLFYEKNRILEAEAGVRESRAAAAAAARIVLGKTLRLLGMTCPETM